jgi:nucleoporin p58/p45
MFSQTQNKPFNLGASTAGNGFAASQQGVQHQNFDNVKGTTRFSDLHPDIQNSIQELDKRFQERIDKANGIREALPKTGESVASIAPDVAFIEEFLSTVELGIDNDTASVAHLKELVKKDATDAALSFRAIVNLKLPQQFHYGNRTNLSASARPNPTPSNAGENDPSEPVNLLGYFTTRTDDLARTLDLYQGQIREIEAHLRTMEAGTVEKAQQLTGSRNGARDQRRELVEALKAIEGAILDSAKKVGMVRDAVTKETLGHVGSTLL